MRNVEPNLSIHPVDGLTTSTLGGSLDWESSTGDGLGPIFDIGRVGGDGEGASGRGAQRKNSADALRRSHLGSGRNCSANSSTTCTVGGRDDASVSTTDEARVFFLAPCTTARI